MNKQEMFTKVWRGLETQKWEKSRADKIGCLYRGPNGMKCAAGHLIPDEKYKPKMEGDPILLLLTHDPSLFGEPITDEDMYFVYDMQQAHDSFVVFKNGEIVQTPSEASE